MCLQVAFTKNIFSHNVANAKGCDQIMDIEDLDVESDSDEIVNFEPFPRESESSEDDDFE